jgi:hypothetical protein
MSLPIIRQSIVSELPAAELEPSCGPPKRVSKRPVRGLMKILKMKFNKSQPIYLIQIGIYSIQVNYIFTHVWSLLA